MTNLLGRLEYTHRPLNSPFCGSYLESYKETPKKELLRGLWVESKAATPCGRQGVFVPSAKLKEI